MIVFRNSSSVSVFVSGSMATPYRYDSTAESPYGVLFDSRTVDAAGNPGATGTLVTLLGQYNGDETYGTEETAGHVDGLPDVSKMYGPNALTVGADGFLYSGELANEGGQRMPDYSGGTAGYTVRKINRTTGLTTTIAGEPGVLGSVDGPYGTNRLAVLSQFVPTTTGLLTTEFEVDYEANIGTVRFIGYDGTVTTIIGLEAELTNPNGVTMDYDGHIWVLLYRESGNSIMLRRDKDTGMMEEWAVLPTVSLNVVTMNTTEMLIVGFAEIGIFNIVSHTYSTLAVLDPSPRGNGGCLGPDGWALYIDITMPGDLQAINLSTGEIVGDLITGGNLNEGIQCAYDGTDAYVSDYKGQIVGKVRMPAL